MWVTQREDQTQAADRQTPLGILTALAACFSTVKSRRQPVFSLLPPFGHFVSGARFAFRTSLIVFALTRYKNILSRCVWVSASNVARRRVQHKREALKLLKQHKICSKMGNVLLENSDFRLCFCFGLFNVRPAVCSTIQPFRPCT